MANEPTDSFLEIDENRQEENKNMPNVKFKRGVQSSLFTFQNNVPVINSNVTIEDGTFYLTTDTNRLFVGNQKDINSPVELIELNKSVTTVNNISDLPTKGVALGQFAYVFNDTTAGHNTHEGNILAIWDGTTWIQVNPDTDTNDNDNTSVRGTNNTAMVNLSGDNAAAAETNDNNTNNNTRFRYRGISNGKAQYELVIEQVTSHIVGNDTYPNDIIAKFEIDLNDIISNSSAVDVTNGVITGNKTTISTTGNGSGGDGFTIEGSTTVTLSATSTGIKIDSDNTEYNINSPQGGTGSDKATSASINLGIAGGAETGGGTVTVKAGEDLLINNATAGEFTIYHKDSGVTAGTYADNTRITSTADIASNGFKVPKIVVDAQGHVTSASEQTLQLPEDSDTYVGTISAGSDGKINITHAGSASNTISSGADLYYTIDIYNADGTTKNTTKSGTKLNQANLGSFYDKDAIDKKLQAVNAMTYKGALTSASELPSSGVSNGDTYLMTVDSDPYKKGDLLIAMGTEGADGTIPAANLKWTPISWDTDTDTTYTFGVASNGPTLTYTPDPGTETPFANFVGDGNGSGAGLIETKREAGASGQPDIIKIEHKAPNKTTLPTTGKGLAANTSNLQHNGTFKVPYVTVDSYGHVTSLAEHTVTLPDDDDTTYEMKVVAGTPTIVLHPSEGNDDEVSFSAGNAITLTATTDNIDIKHNDITRNDPDVAIPDSSLAHEGTFDVVTGVTSNAQGHITGVTKTRYTLPSDNNTTYELKSATLSGLAQGTTGAQLLLDGSEGTDTFVNITSQSLSIVATPTDAISVDLVWGSF